MDKILSDKKSHSSVYFLLGTSVLMLLASEADPIATGANHVHKSETLTQPCQALECFC